MPPSSKQVQKIVGLVKNLTDEEKVHLAIVLREKSAIPEDDQIIKSLASMVNSLNTTWGHTIREKQAVELLTDKLMELCQLQNELLSRRDRPSAPKTEERDERIHSLRMSDAKKWSWGMLAREFKITKRAAEKALDRHRARLQHDIEMKNWEDRLARNDASTIRVQIEFVEEMKRQVERTLANRTHRGSMRKKKKNRRLG